MTHNSAFEFPVVIVGGGMVGASLALMLAREGIPSTLIEARAIAQSKTDASQWKDIRSTALSKLTCDIYKYLDLWSDHIAEAGAAIRKVHVSAQGRLGVTRLEDEHEKNAPLGFVVPNDHLLASLYGSVKNHPLIHLKEQTTLITAERKSSNIWQLELSAGDILQTQYLVICDGVNSASAGRLGVDYEEFDYLQTACVANIRVEMDHQGTAYERFLRDGAMAVLPLADRRCSLIWVSSTERVASVMSCSKQQQIHFLQSQFGERLGSFIEMGEAVQFPLRRICAKELARPGLAICGNAAHNLHPIAGQSFNLAMRGANALVSALVDDPQTAMSRYGAQQKHDLQYTQTALDWMMRSFDRSVPGITYLSQLGLIGLNNAPSLKSQFTNRAMGMRDSVRG